MTSLKSMAFALLIAAFGVLGSNASVLAQTSRSSSVIFAVTDELSTPEAIALIVRHRDPSKDDMIVLRRSNLEPVTIATALKRLEDLRTTGDPPAGQQVLTITSVRTTPRQIVRLSGRYNALLNRLAHQPTVAIGNLGKGQWLRLAGTRSE